MSEAELQGGKPVTPEPRQVLEWSSGQLVYAGIWAVIALLIIAASSTLWGLMVFAYFMGPMVFYRRCQVSGVVGLGVRMAAVLALSTVMAFMVLGSSAYKREQEQARQIVSAGLITDEREAMGLVRELGEDGAASAPAQSLTASEFAKFMLYLGAMAWVIVTLSRNKGAGGEQEAAQKTQGI